MDLDVFGVYRVPPTFYHKIFLWRLKENVHFPNPLSKLYCFTIHFNTNYIIKVHIDIMKARL